MGSIWHSGERSLSLPRLALALRGVSDRLRRPVLKDELPQGFDGEECAGWEEVGDDAKEEIGEGPTAAEQAREAIGGHGSADDGLKCGTEPLLAGNGPPLLAIEPMEVGRGQPALSKGRGDLLGRQLRASERVI